MEEIWKEVVGYEGLYEVSNQGAVRSLSYHLTRQTKVLKLCKDHNGYLQVNLCKDGRQKSFTVHRLVARAFLPNPGNLPEVNHKNEDKISNFVFVSEDGTVVPEKSNLEWCTQSYNNNYGTRIERVAKVQLNDPIKSKPVLQYDLSGNLVKKWPSAHEAQRQTGWRHSNISACCLGKLKTAYRHVWRFVDDVFSETVQDTLF